MNFAPINDTWTRESSLGYASWQPYPELSAPAKKENYDGSSGYLYAQNTCNPSMAGPPTTNGYNITDRQLPKKEGFVMERNNSGPPPQVNFRPLQIGQIINALPTDGVKIREAINEFNNCTKTSTNCSEKASVVYRLRESCDSGKKTECYENSSQQQPWRYKKENTTWLSQKPYTL
jgi:hypothetical protein